MHYSSIPEKPLNASINSKIEEAERIYFFERPDGSRIFAKDREAWNLYSRRPQILGKYTQAFKLLGSSDGTTYQQAVREAQEIYFQTNDLQKAQDRLRKGEFEEFEKAKGNLTPPPDYDKMGTGAKYIM